MTQPVEVIVSNIKKTKRWRKLFVTALWGSVILSVSVDIFQIYWVSNHFQITLSEILALDDFAAGGLFTVSKHPSYLVAASIRCHLLVIKLLLGVIFSGLFHECWKHQDLVVSLYQTVVKRG